VEDSPNRKYANYLKPEIFPEKYLKFIFYCTDNTLCLDAFEVHTAAIMKSTILWNVTSYYPVEVQ
jgi:hypothetical protein